MRRTGGMKEYGRRILDWFDKTPLRKALATIAGSRSAILGPANGGTERYERRLETPSFAETMRRAFREKVEAAGAHFHQAADRAEAAGIIARIAAGTGSRLAVRTQATTAAGRIPAADPALGGLKIVETDLGEWIRQLDGEPTPSAADAAELLSRERAADILGREIGRPVNPDIPELIGIARRELRTVFADADMGITGVDVAVAETGSLGMATAQGNARLATTLPRVHVAIVGAGQLVPTLDQALRILTPADGESDALPPPHVTWITGPSQCRGGGGGRREMHIVLLGDDRRPGSGAPPERQRAGRSTSI